MQENENENIGALYAGQLRKKEDLSDIQAENLEDFCAILSEEAPAGSLDDIRTFKRYQALFVEQIDLNDNFYNILAGFNLLKAASENISVDAFLSVVKAHYAKAGKTAKKEIGTGLQNIIGTSYSIVNAKGDSLGLAQAIIEHETFKKDMPDILKMDIINNAVRNLDGKERIIFAKQVMQSDYFQRLNNIGKNAFVENCLLRSDVTEQPTIIPMSVDHLIYLIPNADAPYPNTPIAVSVDSQAGVTFHSSAYGARQARDDRSTPGSKKIAGLFNRPATKFNTLSPTELVAVNDALDDLIERQQRGELNISQGFAAKLAEEKEQAQKALGNKDKKFMPSNDVTRDLPAAQILDAA